MHDWKGRSCFVAGAAGAQMVAVLVGRIGDGSVEVTVKHVFGETTMPPAQACGQRGPHRTGRPAAVGIVPIAVTDWLGGEPFAVWPGRSRNSAAPSRSS